MTLAERLRELVDACFTGLWIQSHEHDDAISEIGRLCHEHDWRLATWDVARGLSVAAAGENATTEIGPDPLAALRALPALATQDGTSLLVLVNFHRFLQSAEIVQTLVRQVTAGKQSRTFVVILSPVVQIPVELEKLFLVVEHELPTREQLLELAHGIATGADELPSAAQLDAVLDAAAGLTRYEAEAAYSLSLVRHGRLTPEALWQIKSGLLKKSGLLQLHRGDERFDQLGGLDGVKAFCRRALRTGAGRADVRARGILLLGVPGTGKSALAKALGNETARPTLTLDVGSLMGGIVGDTERNIRQALRIADAMAPSILFLDEVEKGLSGVASSGQTDGGVSARLFGTFLTWLNDHTSDVFVIATCNDIAKLPPEFSRAERFDGCFFLDLPDESERRAIWTLYLAHFALDASQSLPADAEWTGAEIRACCRLAALLDLPLGAAAENIVPVARTAAESVDRLRTWASGRCLNASRSGVYRGPKVETVKTARRVRRDPSSN
jgi:hypothetical protein